MSLTFRVHGIPAPQGSKRHVGNGVMVESSKKVKPWRQDVKYAALEAVEEPLAGAVHVSITFYLPRPKGHYGTGRNVGRLRESAPAWPKVKPDLDKLVRSTLDAIGEAGAWEDDSRVVSVSAMKVYADGQPPGALVNISEVDMLGGAA